MTRTMAAMAFALIAVTLLSAQEKKKDADKPVDKKDLEKIAGKWQPTSLQAGEVRMTDAQMKATTLVIDGDKYTVTIKGEKDTAETDKGTLKIDVLAKPMSMDITSTAGPNKGKVMLAIYEISGDTLKVCYDLDGKKRPTEFKVTGEKIALISYKRLKG
jgi:uncharacterized protein (TIGR03067 family)